MSKANGEKAERELSTEVDRGLRLLAIAALVAVVTVTIACDDLLTTDEAVLALGALLLALLLAAIPLRRLTNLRSVKAFGVGVELAEQAVERAETVRFKEEETGSDVAGVNEIVDLQLLLEAKLAYVAKHVLASEASGYRASFATIGSLEYDKLLDREDALAARELLALTASDIERSSEAQRTKYREKAKALVGGIRATIFYKLVERLVKETAGQPARRLERHGENRADLWLDLEVGGKRVKVLIFPAFAVPGAYWFDAERLARRATELATSSDVALIVVPPAWRARLAPEVDGIKILPVRRLMTCADNGTGLAELLTRLLPALRS